jgi:negative regulator of flagellin synthesis FlgM
MSIQIDPKRNPLLDPDMGISLDKNSYGKKTDTDAAASAAATLTDKIELTAHSKTLKELEQKISALPDVDMEKVAEVKARIASGQYRMDAERIADKMLAMDVSDK